MTKLTVRAYQPEDFLAIELMDYERKCREGQPVDRWALVHGAAGPAVTVFDPENRIVFCCGIHTLWPGVGELWAVFSPLARRYPDTWQAAKRLARWAMTPKPNGGGFVRLQTVLDPVGCPETIRLNERLGFRPEGRLRRYGPHGEDRLLYAMVVERTGEPTVQGSLGEPALPAERGTTLPDGGDQPRS